MNFDSEYLYHSYIIGCDEVGRGPLAGPVVAAAVLLEDSACLSELADLQITDSKKISPKKRKNILHELDLSQLKKNKKIQIWDGLSYSIFEVSPEQIDKINILQASLLAMQKACQILEPYETNGLILIDGNKTFDSIIPTKPIVKGDSKSLIIGLASIIAKEFRDEKMRYYDGIYPGYDFTSHAGYPTKFHREAIGKIGISPIHRKTFKGVKEFI